MQVESGRLLEAIELIAASAWGTEGALRAWEGGRDAEGQSLLVESRRPLLRGLAQLRDLAEECVRHGGHDDARQVLAEIERLRELVEGRSAGLAAATAAS